MNKERKKKGKRRGWKNKREKEKRNLKKENRETKEEEIKTEDTKKNLDKGKGTKIDKGGENGKREGKTKQRNNYLEPMARNKTEKK